MKNIKISGPAEHVRLITLNRPKALNALSKALLTEIASALEEARYDDTVRCVVITGDKRAFSSGADIKEMPENGIPMWAAADRLRAWKYIEEFSKPLIAAVNGYALGGGCELMLLCDMAIGGENVQLGTPEVKIAAFPGDGGTQRLPRAIGKARAMMMVLSGEFIGAEKAQEWGLIVEVTPIEKTVERAIEIASIISANSPIAVRMAKEEILMTYEKPLDESLSLERKLLLWQTEDHDEGIAAFIEKRLPRFTGR